MPIRDVSLPQGTVRYLDSDPGGTPSAVVLVHGLLVDGGLWDGVVERLAPTHRCVVPALPLGCHELPLAAGADRSPGGVARLLADLLEALGLDDVTLVGNDTGGALCQLLVTRHPQRVGRLVLTNCDTYTDFLPPVFRPLQWLAHAPAAFHAIMRPMRRRRLRNSPLGFGLLTVDPLDAALGARWVDAFLADAGVREDALAFLRAVDPADTVQAAAELEAYDRPVLFAWAPADRFFKLANAERLAAAIPDARVERIEDARTFVSLDRPDRVAELVGAFVRETAGREADGLRSPA